MFGDFLNNHKEIIPKDGYFQIKNGSPIVAIRFSDNKAVFSDYLQFGIFDGKESVICQFYDTQTGSFFIKKVFFPEFLKSNCKLFEYTPNFEYDVDQTIGRANNLIGLQINDTLLSAPGDDFVFWCLTENTIEQHVDNLNIGLHFSSKFKMAKVAVAYHHCIRIECDNVIHFDSGDEYTRPFIRVDSIEKYKEYYNSFFQVPYENENTSNRLYARNNAMLVLTGKHEFDHYKLFANNCEHFASWCKTGEKNSAQVKQIGTDLLTVLLHAAAGKPSPLLMKLVNKRFSPPWKNV